MLKDLEQRTPEQGQAPIATISAQKSSTFKMVLISAVVLLSLNALGFYIWSLQERVEKSELALQKTVNTKSAEQVIIHQPIKTKKLKNQNQNQNQQETSDIKNVEKVLANKSNEVAQKKVTLQEVTSTNKVSQNSHLQLSDESKSVPQQQNKENSEVVQVNKVAEHLPLPNNETSKMSVSRRQLTSKELVAQKLAKAEKSVNLNEVAKAEQLFEDILIIDPYHKQARKNLAALWFGRKSYQQAVNLLSQGIAIDKQDDELRLMKAQIHLKQGQVEAAFNSLKPLASFEQEEYQVMLANIAQQIEQYPSAIDAYKVLIKMQPYSGRWHLGLAIVYDKNSQFLLAVNEYALALTKADLSVSSVKFAEQRMQALGE